MSSKKILNWNQFKKINENSSYGFSNEYEEENTKEIINTDMENSEEESDTVDFNDTDDETEIGSEETSADSEETEEDSELKIQIRSLIEDNYKTNIKDLFTGVINELDDSIDMDDVIAIVIDIFKENVELIASGDDEEEEEEEGETESEEGVESTETEGTETEGTEAEGGEAEGGESEGEETPVV